MKKKPGVFILKRQDRQDDKIIDDLAEVLFRFALLSKKERIENKIEAGKIAALADWKVLAKKYLEAHNLAFKNDKQCK